MPTCLWWLHMNSFSDKNVRRLHCTDVLNDDDDNNDDKNKKPLQSPIIAQKPPHKPGQNTTKPTF